MNIIEIENLSKSFKDVKAVQNLSFKVKEGELFAFLGLNGAGKSTTIAIMCGQLSRDNGNVTIDGTNLDHDVNKIKREIGVVFQESCLDKALTVYDNLKYRAALYGIVNDEFRKRLDDLVEMLDFKSFLKRPVGKLSGGERRKVDIARALIHEPRILILDEPTTGLDPKTRRVIWDVLSTLRSKKKLTVFLTTHYMEESADADYVVILDSGKIAGEGTPLQLKNKYSGDFLTLYNATPEEISTIDKPYETIRDAHRFAIANTIEATELILKHPDIFKDYEITKGKMDDVFLAVTGKKLNGGDEA